MWFQSFVYSLISSGTIFRFIVCFLQLSELAEKMGHEFLRVRIHLFPKKRFGDTSYFGVLLIFAKFYG